MSHEIAGAQGLQFLCTKLFSECNRYRWTKVGLSVLPHKLSAKHERVCVRVCEIDNSWRCQVKTMAVWQPIEKWGQQILQNIAFTDYRYPTRLVMELVHVLNKEN